MARLTSGGSRTIAILKYITSEHNAFSIRKLKEMEQKNFGKSNCGPKFAVVVLHDFSGDCSIISWTGHDFSRTFIRIFAYHSLQMGRGKIKEILKNTKKNSQIHFVQRILGRLIMLH